MLNIRAEFPDRRPSKAFLVFLQEARQIRGYRKVLSPGGRLVHRIDFTEPGYIKISGNWGYALERRWDGAFFLNGKLISQTRLWQRYLRSADVMDRTTCPACGTALGRLPLKVNFILKDGREIDYVVLCICGSDITGLYSTAHAIATARTPRELVSKSRGEA